MNIIFLGKLERSIIDRLSVSGNTITIVSDSWLTRMMPFGKGICSGNPEYDIRIFRHLLCNALPQPLLTP